MLAHGYSRSNYDHCIYLKQFPNGSFVYLLLYVDDMLIASHEKSLIVELKAQLSHEFHMKDLGPAKKILGMEIQRDRHVGTLFLYQKSYIEKVLEKYNLSNCKYVATPFASHLKLSLRQCPIIENEKEHMSHRIHTDMLTKPLSNTKFKHCLDLVGVHGAQHPSSVWGNSFIDLALRGDLLDKIM